MSGSSAFDSFVTCSESKIHKSRFVNSSFVCFLVVWGFVVVVFALFFIYICMCVGVRGVNVCVGGGAVHVGGGPRAFVCARSHVYAFWVGFFGFFFLPPL